MEMAKPLFVTLNVATFLIYPNNLQIFNFCCMHGNKKEQSKLYCHMLFEVKQT
jgi:hypothetical protein